MRTVAVCLLAASLALFAGCGGTQSTVENHSTAPVTTAANTAPVNATPFSVVVLPDTQNYSQYYPATFKAQTQWVIDNRTTRNIKFVLGLGDVVNNGSSATQYDNADAAIRLLDDAGMPYVVALGNHDYRDADPRNRDATLFNQYFGPQRYAKYSWYKGHHPEMGNENFYTVFNVEGQDYMILALEFSPRDTALNWAGSVLDANPDKQVILVTHSFMLPGDMRAGTCEGTWAFGMTDGNDGQVVWENFVRKHKNIIMVLNGHFHGSGRRAELGDNGNLVTQMLSDYQDLPNGGDGYMRIMTFRPAENRVDVETYSPTLKKDLTTEGENNFSTKLYNDGQPGPYATGVKGRVFRTDCSMLAGATASGGNVQAITGSDGEFMLPTGTGAYAVLVNASGMKSQTQSTQVNQGYSAQLDYYMAP